MPVAFAAVHEVQVGAGGQLLFSPEAIVSTNQYLVGTGFLHSIFFQAASAGDQVVFHFNPKNHSVTQSSFASPCGFKSGGINSGLYVDFLFRVGKIISLICNRVAILFRPTRLLFQLIQ